ncbi:NifU family protein [Capnocytophaga cynodegmi]|uniref:NifU-like protein 4 n=1 Tax=Capnocytophaga cynodegmi TaxID=28189 RepID=A0A0B7H9J0_9FLAO|nr:NifU N-terminal domain-containing protein [Capnocytophaga cynodegmi]CEN34632.1 NifU-like protein 4 [Capnocytophaga cynodegmi]
MTDITLSIQTTNNPEIIKLEASKALVKGSYEFKNIDEAKNSPLAKQLFYLPFIKTIYISSNFIALKRYPIVEWEDVQEEVAEQVLEYIKSGKELITNDSLEVKNPITVYAESTPNPAVMKFVVNKQLVPEIFEYKNISEAKDAPLVTALFEFLFVKEVFLDNNYISVTKHDVVDWYDVVMELREFIRNYLVQGNAVILSGEIKKRIEKEQKKENKVITTDITSKKIISILDQYIKPAVTLDGGNIEFVSYNDDNHLVEVILQGACSGCPSSTLTLKNGIESILKEQLQNPDIRVVAVNG